jgi:hypothetical protein
VAAGLTITIHQHWLALKHPGTKKLLTGRVLLPAMGLTLRMCAVDATAGGSPAAPAGAANSTLDTAAPTTALAPGTFSN